MTAPVKLTPLIKQVIKKLKMRTIPIQPAPAGRTRLREVKRESRNINLSFINKKSQEQALDMEQRMFKRIFFIALGLFLTSFSATTLASAKISSPQLTRIEGTIQSVQDGGYEIKLNNENYTVTPSTQISYSGASQQYLPITVLQPGILIRIAGTNNQSLLKITILPK